jgi:hypothetical protein
MAPGGRDGWLHSKCTFKPARAILDTSRAVHRTLLRARIMIMICRSYGLPNEQLSIGFMEEAARLEVHGSKSILPRCLRFNVLSKIEANCLRRKTCQNKTAHARGR